MRFFDWSNVTANLENKSQRPNKRGVSSLSVIRHRTGRTAFFILIVIFVEYTLTGSFVMPYEIPTVHSVKSIPNISANLRGSIVQSAPESRRNFTGSKPNLVRISTSIMGSQMSPKRICFLPKGSSIDTDRPFGWLMRDYNIMTGSILYAFLLECLEETTKGLCMGNYLSMDLSDKLAFFWPLELLGNFLSLHNFHLYKIYHKEV